MLHFSKRISNLHHPAKHSGRCLRLETSQCSPSLDVVDCFPRKLTTVTRSHAPLTPANDCCVRQTPISNVARESALAADADLHLESQARCKGRRHPEFGKTNVQSPGMSRVADRTGIEPGSAEHGSLSAMLWSRRRKRGLSLTSAFPVIA